MSVNDTELGTCDMDEIAPSLHAQRDGRGGSGAPWTAYSTIDGRVEGYGATESDAYANARANDECGPA